jgi:ribosome-binding ATPase YchF (GTP1/OBG family)
MIINYVALKGKSGARDAGKLRQDGKEYVIQNEDVLPVKFDV